MSIGLEFVYPVLRSFCVTLFNNLYDVFQRHQGSGRIGAYGESANDSLTTSMINLKQRCEAMRVRIVASIARPIGLDRFEIVVSSR